jgi:antitoxin SocA-like protein
MVILWTLGGRGDMALNYKTGGFKKKKFKALVQFICSWCADEPSRLGYTKLNKILWFAETNHYLKTGVPLTGANYVKRQHGPVPACIEFMVEELVQERKLFVREVPFYGLSKAEFIPLEEISNIDEFFTASEIEDVTRIIDSVCNEHTAKSISKKSHTENWRVAKIGEKLPLYTILSKGEVTEEHMKWADKKIAQLEGAAAR